MKRKKIFFLLLGFIVLLGLASCKRSENEDMAVATFMLEGGTCQNNTDKVSYAYKIKKNEVTYIASPNDLKPGDVFRTGYTLEGWYLTKNGEGDSATYSNKWDFRKDLMTYEGITLYARWVLDAVYKFEIYSFDNKNGQPLGTYTVSSGAAFSDYLRYASKYGNSNNKTCIGFVDENGTEVVPNVYTHPGGEESLTIKIYAKFIDGKYAVVSNKKELLAATGENIYLVDDIDLGGDSFSFSTYKGHEFVGNNHIISNFTLNYSLSDLKDDLLGNGTTGNVYISLFYNIENSTIKDVKFQNVKINIKGSYDKVNQIYFAPFATTIKKSTISNVSVSGELSITTKIPCEVITDQLYYLVDEDSKVENCLVEIINK